MIFASPQQFYPNGSFTTTKRISTHLVEIFGQRWLLQLHQHHGPASKTAIIDCYAFAMYTGTARPPLQHMPSACWHAPTGTPAIRPRHAWGATRTTAVLLMNVELTIDTSLLEVEYSTPPYLCSCTKTTAAHTALPYTPLLDMSAMPCWLKRRASSV